MDYELAKELKDAGFPQKEPQVIWKGITVSGNKLEPVYIPSLSELIKACGDDFWVLRQQGDRTWVTFSDKEEEFGSTPEEAVAMLYVALNKK